MIKRMMNAQIQTAIEAEKAGLSPFVSTGIPICM